MRKCVSCGYLVLGDTETCKHCGALLPRAATPQTAPPVLVPVGAPTTNAAPPPPPDLGYWTPPPPVAPAPPAPPARSKSRTLLGLVVVVSMAFGWIAYDHMRATLPPGTSDFVAGHGVPYSSPDRTFDAEFPSTPNVQRQVIPVASTSATINLAQAQTDDYEVVAASVVLPVVVPSAQVESIIHAVLNEATAAQGAKINDEQPIEHDGARGLEVRATVRDGYAARFIVLVSGTRIYLLGTHAKRGTDRLYDALLASLVMH